MAEMSLENLAEQYQIISEVVKRYSRKVEDIVRLCEKRAQVEALYSKGMMQIAELKTSIDGGTLLFGLQAYQVEALNKAEQSRVLSESMISDLVDMLRSTLQEQAEIENSYNSQIKELQSEWGKVKKQLRTRKEAYTKAHSQVEKLLFELEELRKKELLETASGINKNIQLAEDLQKHEEAREAYKEIAQYAQKFSEQYFAAIKYIIESLKALIVKKIDVIKSALQYHFNLLSTEDKFKVTIEEIHGDQDLAQILDGLPLIKEPSDSIFFEKIESGWERLYELYLKHYYNNKENLIYYSSLVEETKEYILQEEDKEFQEIYQLFQMYCSKILNDGLNPEKSLIRQVEDTINKPKGRLAFIRALAGTPPPFQFSGDSLKHLQILSCKFLNLAMKADEYELILDFTETAKQIPISESNTLLQ